MYMHTYAYRYLGKKSRIEAEQALQRMRDSVFLIRESDVRSGEYAIALKLVYRTYMQYVEKHAHDTHTHDTSAGGIECQSTSRSSNIRRLEDSTSLIFVTSLLWK